MTLLFNLHFYENSKRDRGSNKDLVVGDAECSDPLIVEEPEVAEEDAIRSS